MTRKPPHIDDSWIIDLRGSVGKGRNVEAEYGTSGGLGFANMKATMYDSDGNEVADPVCEKCGVGKTCLIGREAYCWICQNPECK